MATDEVAGYLDSISGTHNPAQVEDASTNVPDGTYQVRLDAIYFRKIDSNDKIKNVMEFEVMGGKFVGRKIFKWGNMDTAANLDWLTRDFRILGVPVNFKWNTVEKEFNNLIDKLYEIETKTKGDFQNVYIKKQLKQDEVFIGAGLNKDKDVPF